MDINDSKNKSAALQALCRNYAAWLLSNSGYVVNDANTFEQWLAQEGPSDLANVLMAPPSQEEKTDRQVMQMLYEALHECHAWGKSIAKRFAPIGDVMLAFQKETDALKAAEERGMKL